MLEIGFDDFLRKPFHIVDIFDLMAKHLDIRYVYAEKKQSTIDNRQSTIEDVLTPDALGTLPKELFAGLHEAVEAFDLHTANLMIERIREHNGPLANALADVVKQFRFDKLQKLFRTFVD